MAMNEFTFQNVSEALIEAVPELRKPYEEELENWKGAEEPPGGYNIFGAVVVPFFTAELKSGKNPGLLKRMFDFFEAMALSKDSRVVGLLAIEILEPIVASQRKQKKALPYMGAATKKLADEIAERRKVPIAE